MQNWALQQELMSMGHVPVTIDVYRKYPYFRWLMTSLRLKVDNFLGRNDLIVPDKPIRGRCINPITAPFIFENINMSPPYYTLNSELLIREKLDCIIVGSDQVWRPRYNPHLKEMFLDFARGANIKRISYAASFGSEEWEMDDEQTEVCRQLIHEFDGVSVREISGVDLCKQHFGIDAVCVLDPTMLIDEELYFGLCDGNKRTISEKPFLAFYCLDFSEKKQKIAEQIAQNKNLEIRKFSAGPNLKLSVSEWLDTIRRAAYVLTDSFHGTVFAILFEKDFMTVFNKKRGGARFRSLFESLNIKGHVMTEDDFWKDNERECVDWCVVKQNLNKLKRQSHDFLYQSINTNA